MYVYVLSGQFIHRLNICPWKNVYGIFTLTFFYLVKKTFAGQKRTDIYIFNDSFASLKSFFDWWETAVHVNCYNMMEDLYKISVLHLSEYPTVSHR